MKIRTINELPNIQKQTQEVKQYEETGEYVPNGRAGKISAKELNGMEIGNMHGKDFKVMVRETLLDLRKDCQISVRPSEKRQKIF